jgi:hypothetical protein
MELHKNRKIPVNMNENWRQITLWEGRKVIVLLTQNHKKKWKPGILLMFLPRLFI